MWLAVVVDVEFLGPTKLDDFRFCLVIFFDILLLLKLQIELRGIHRNFACFKSRVDLCSLITEVQMERREAPLLWRYLATQSAHTSNNNNNNNNINNNKTRPFP